MNQKEASEELLKIVEEKMPNIYWLIQNKTLDEIEKWIKEMIKDLEFRYGQNHWTIIAHKETLDKIRVMREKE